MQGQQGVEEEGQVLTLSSTQGRGNKETERREVDSAQCVQGGFRWSSLRLWWQQYMHGCLPPDTLLVVSTIQLTGLPEHKLIGVNHQLQQFDKHNSSRNTEPWAPTFTNAVPPSTRALAIPAVYVSVVSSHAPSSSPPHSDPPPPSNTSLSTQYASVHTEPSPP